MFRIRRVPDDMTPANQRVVAETLKEIGADGKPTLLVFNKIDKFENPDRVRVLKSSFPDAAYISAARGIGISDLTSKLNAVIDTDFKEEILYLPVEDQGEIAKIRKWGEVLSEDYLEAMNGTESDNSTVVRLHFRTAKRNRKDIIPIVKKYRDFRPELIPDSSEPEVG